MSILDQVKEGLIRDLVAKGKRADGRGLLDYRPVSIERGVLPNAEGSAWCNLGDTKVLAGVKFDVMTPFPDRPTEGVFMVNAEFAPLGHPEFEAGPPREDSIEFARVVDRGIRSAEAINTKDFFIEEGKVLGLFVDLYVLDHNGNLADAGALAAAAALKDTRVPKLEGGKIVRGEFAGRLQVERVVVSSSFERISGRVLVDATNAEEVASEGRVTFSTCSDELLCSAQKSGPAGFTHDALMDLADKAFDKRKELVAAVERA